VFDHKGEKTPDITAFPKDTNFIAYLGVNLLMKVLDLEKKLFIGNLLEAAKTKSSSEEAVGEGKKRNY